MTGVNNELYYVDKRDEQSVQANAGSNAEENYEAREAVYTKCREQLQTQFRY